MEYITELLKSTKFKMRSMFEHIFFFFKQISPIISEVKSDGEKYTII